MKTDSNKILGSKREKYTVPTTLGEVKHKDRERTEEINGEFIE